MDELLESPGASPDPTVIGGYRTMRTLGVGDRARVLLAASDAGAPIALKRYRDSVADAAIIREAAILDALADPHAVPLLDVGSDSGGRPVLVLEPFRGGSLAELVARRTRVAPGESVTALAPIAELIGRLHERGLAHGAIAAKHVVFSADGVPVLGGWGSAVTRGDAEFERVRDEDCAALLMLARGLLPELGVDSGERMPRPPELVDLLHSTVAAAPVDLRAIAPEADQPARPPSTDPSHIENPARLATNAGGSDSDSPAPVHASVPTPAPAPGLLFALAEWPDRLVQLLGRGDQQRGGLAGATVRRIADRCRTQIAALSRRQRILGAAGLTALLLAAVLLAQPPGWEPPEVPTGSPSIAHEPRGMDESTGVGAPAAQGDAQRSAIEGPDPEPALRALLGLREQCLLDLSLSCLASVVQTGSSAERDAIEVLVGGSGAQPPLAPMPDEYQVIAVDRLGDSVLFRIEAAETIPASVLMIRTEAGWRIRMLAAA